MVAHGDHGIASSDAIGKRLHSIVSRLQEAYSVARQFNLIPPVCEQSEYHLFQREKVEVLLPDVFHKIGSHRTASKNEKEKRTLSQALER